MKKAGIMSVRELKEREEFERLRQKMIDEMKQEIDEEQEKESFWGD